MKSESISKLIGTIAHFCYWAVFGGFNAVPMDNFHLEAIFKSALK